MSHNPVVRCEAINGNKHKKSKMQNALQNFENRDLAHSDLLSLQDMKVKDNKMDYWYFSFMS